LQKNKTNLFAELGRRGVYQAVGIYVAVAWGSVEILITSSERFGWPQWLGDAALILFLTALPFVVLLSWAFDLIGTGLKKVDAGSLTGKGLIAATLTIVLGLSSSWFITREGPEIAFEHKPVTFEGQPVIAVMPFSDLTGLENGELLALSFTDELINRVNSHPDLVALNFQSVQTLLESYSDNDNSAVPADFILQGTLRSAQVGIELQVRMQDRQGLTQWEYDAIRNFRNPREARQTQERLAGEIASGLGLELTGNDYCQPSENKEALDLFYQARKMFNLRGAENIAGAARLLERAVELDPGYARALDLLGAVYQRFQKQVMTDPSQYEMDEDQLQVFIDSEPYLPVLKHALALCPGLGSAYATVELSAPVLHNTADLVDIILEGLRRDPANTPLMDWAIYIYLDVGHVDAALGMAKDFYKRDPLNPRAPHLLALVYRALGDSQGALGLEKEAAALGWVRGFEPLLLAYDRVVSGAWDELEASMEEIQEPHILSLPFDPRLLRDMETQVSNRTLLEQQLTPESLEARQIGIDSLIAIGGGFNWAFELNDSELAWRLLTDYAKDVEEQGWGRKPMGIWFKRHRHWFGNQRILELSEEWGNSYSVFWNRHGAPDGCSWNGALLDCEWAEAAP
jgi:TolB-like protein